MIDPGEPNRAGNSTIMYCRTLKRRQGLKVEQMLRRYDGDAGARPYGDIREGVVQSVLLDPGRERSVPHQERPGLLGAVLPGLVRILVGSRGAS